MQQSFSHMIGQPRFSFSLWSLLPHPFVSQRCHLLWYVPFGLVLVKDTRSFAPGICLCDTDFLHLPSRNYMVKDAMLDRYNTNIKPVTVNFFNQHKKQRKILDRNNKNWLIVRLMNRHSPSSQIGKKSSHNFFQSS